MFAVVSGHGTVSSFSLHSLTIRSDENRGHQTKRSVTLCENIRLYVAVVVLAGPHKTALGLEHLCNHIVNETMFIPNSKSIELFLVVLLVNSLEDILKATIVSLQDGVLCAKIHGHLSVNGNTEAGMGKTFDGLIGVVHGHGDTAGLLKGVDLELAGFGAIFGSEDHLELAGSVGNKVRSTILTNLN